MHVHVALLLLLLQARCGLARVSNGHTDLLLAPAGRCCSPAHGGSCLKTTGCLDPEVQPFCAASKANCEGKCKHMWCASTNSSSSDNDFTIDSTVPIHNTSTKYISFTFDLSAWSEFERDHDFADPAFIAAARSFTPCLLRIGGTAEDNTTYDVSGSADAGIPQRVMTKQQWDGINAFATAAGWDIVFGLNALKGWEGSSNWAWDPTNAQELIEYTVRQGYPVVGWELGNEPGLKNKNGVVQTGAGVAGRFRTLLDLLRKVYPAKLGLGTADSPWVIGPDVTKGGVQKGFLADFLKAFRPPNDLSVVSWHHCKLHAPLT
eukprot:COSAG02_NODE_2878_length_7829_cov_2.286287_2_plen_319_part_00